MERESKLIDELLKVSTLEIGAELLARQTDQVFEEIKENVSKDGVKMSDYLTSLNLSEEAYKKQHVESTAQKRLHGEIIFNKLMELENIEASDEELQAEIKKIMGRYQSPDVLKRLEELYVPGTSYYEELKRRMTYRKLIDNFFTEATAKKK
jgi:trigger factor